MAELREGQRVQLNLEQMAPHRREVYAHNGPGEVAGFVGERVWVKFDAGWRTLFLAEEVQPEVVQGSLFNVAAVSTKR